MDTVMSHITHLYHLSAPDFINFETGPVPMSPWLPSYTTTGLVAGGSTLGTALILDYVEALRVRRLCHTAGALYSGRQPIQNAIVPGGVTTHFDGTYPYDPAPTQDQFGPYNATSTQAAFTNILTTIRNFIDKTYIPDVLAVATHANFTGFWTQGAGCMNTLSYGDFPMSGTPGKLLLKRGIASSATTTGNLGAFDQAQIYEQVTYSYYDYAALDAINFPNGRHPFDGLTNPDAATTNGYSWLKAPRYSASSTVYEVGPLARIWNSYLSSDTSLSVTSLNSIAGVLPSGGSYNVRGLATNVVTYLNGLSIPGLSAPTCFFSALGRHACRALEAKLLADACSSWNGVLTPGVSCYDYKKIPKTITTGYGLAEAPRGALGHWIKIEGRKVAKYQCVVPSTWNFSPRDKNNVAGAVEQSLEDSWIGPDSDVQGQIVNILRVVHPFDCCIACAVHVLNPDGKEKLSFSIGPDGRPTNIKISE